MVEEVEDRVGGGGCAVVVRAQCDNNNRHQAPLIFRNFGENRSQAPLFSGYFPKKPRFLNGRAVVAAEGDPSPHVRDFLEHSPVFGRVGVRGGSILRLFVTRSETVCEQSDRGELT